MSVLLGNGDGTFQANQDFATGQQPVSVAIGDLNGDGRLDIVTANTSASSASVLLGNGDGTFQANEDYATGFAPFSVAISDLNGDGKPDIVTANRIASSVSVLLGNGDGTFQANQDYATGSAPRSVAIGDLNGDGWPDLVTANNHGDTVSVLLGTVPSPLTRATVALPSYDSPDPAFAQTSYAWQVGYATCLKLVTYSDDPAPAGYQLVPEAATALPAVSPDGLVYTFTVKSGLRFSDDSSVTADSFRRAIERSAGPGAYGYLDISDIAGIGAFQDGSATSISGVQVTGNQLQITLTQPDAALPAKLAEPYFCAVPADTPLSEQDTVPLLPSAGPYYVASYQAFQNLILRKNPYYTGARPAGFDEINVIFQQDLSGSYAQAQAGQVDYTRVGPADQAAANSSYGPGSPAAAAGHQQYFTPITGVVRYLALNTSRSALQDAEVRQAIATAIDRTQLASDLGEQPTDDLVSPITPGYVDENNFSLSGDVAAAQALMRASGYGPDHHLTLTLVTSASSSRQTLLGRDIVPELANIYIDVTWTVTSQITSFLSNPRADWDMAYFAWVPQYLDWSAVIDPLVDSRTMTGGFENISHWNDAATNSALDYANAPQLDETQRNTAYEHLATSLARDSVPLAGISQPLDHEFVSSRVGCVVQQPVYGLDLTRLCPANPVSAGDTYTQPGTVSSSSPVLAGVTASADGAVSVVSASVSSELSGYNVVGQQLIINAPDAPDTNHPLSITLTIDSATLAAAGLNANTVAVLRNGVGIPACTPNNGTVSNGDDPCVTSRTTDGDGNALITILSTEASVWNSGKLDSTPPTLNSVSLGSSTIAVNGSTTISASAGADAVFAEFYVDTDAGAGNNIPLGGGAGSFVSPPYGQLLSLGLHNIGVRVRDAAGNWSPVTVVQLGVGVTPPTKLDQSITFATPANRTYGDANFDPGATASSGLAVSYGASGACSIVSGKVHLTGAGSCTVTASQNGNSDYNAAPDVQRSFSIGKASLTITARNQQKIRDFSGEPRARRRATVDIEGLVGSDSISSVTLTSAGL